MWPSLQIYQPVQQDLGVVLPPACSASPHLAAQLVQLAPELPHVTGDVSALLRHHETGEQHEGDTGPGHALTDYNTLSRSPGSVPTTGAHLPGAALCPTAPRPRPRLTYVTPLIVLVNENT